MTVGDKIQIYRKSLGMSQEELGQRLLVSRQTISQWEKGQTVPTIDNLIRLKEIFGISVDKILNIENSNETKEQEPYETYKFSFAHGEIDEIYKLQKSSLFKRPITFTLVSILLIMFFVSSSAPGFLIGLAFGMFFIGSVSHIKGILAYKKAWENSKDRIFLSTYEYKIYDSYLLITIYRGNEIIRESKCYFTDIEQIQHVGKYLFFQFDGQSFIIRKSELIENSFFYSFMYRNPAKIIQQAALDKWRVLSIILFVASLFSILGALTLVGVVSSVNHLFVDNMWLFFLLTPIPITSVILGFILKSKGYKYKKNIIAGIIMTLFLCIYGSFTFIF
jgi:transcriptional regulator with XRE-family HTH domain